jgi:aminoglycoside 3-N-acetyltransferase
MTIAAPDDARVADRALTLEPVTRQPLSADPDRTRKPVTRQSLVAGPGRTRKPVTRQPLVAQPGPTRRTVTRKRLIADLSELGVPAGRPLLVHASLSKIGNVKGGAEAVIDALLQVIGPDGTLVTGAGTPENSTTSRAFQARTAGFTPEQVAEYCATMPAFDRATTPTSIGAIAEALRTTPGACRSAHPQSSFVAVGREARALMAGHRIRCHLGEASPLAKLYERDALILLLGADYRACSAFHLAEYRYRRRPPRQVYSCVMKKRGKPRWIEYRDVALDDHDFEIIGNSLEGVLKDQREMLTGRVGRAASSLIPMRRVVDLAAEWMAGHRWLPTVNA